MKIFFVIFLTLTGAACKSKSSQIGSNYDPDLIPDEIVTDRKVDYSGCDTIVFVKGEEIVRLDSIIGETRIVPLETKTESLIGSVQKIIFRNDKFYLFDIYRSKNAIHIFDLTGKHIRTLSRIGRGPGEYRDIMDFDVDDSGNIFLLNASGGNIIVYNEQLNFTVSISPPIYLCSFCLFNNSIIGIVDRTGYRNPTKHLLFVLNMDGTIINSYFPFEQITGGKASVQDHLVVRNHDLFINLPYFETIFSMDTLFDLRANYYLVNNYKDKAGIERNRFQTQPFKSFFQADSFIYVTTNTNPIFPGFYNGESILFNSVSRTKISQGDINPFPLDMIIEGNIGISVRDVGFLLANYSVDDAYEYYDTNKVIHRVKDPLRLGGDTLPGSLYDQVRRMNENDNPVIMLTKLKPF